MIKEGKIGVQEGIALFTITITTRVFFTSPGVLAKALGTTGWYMTLISALVAILGFTFIYRLLKKFPGKNLVDIFNLALGRGLGTAATFLLALMFLINAAIMLREFAEVMKAYVFDLSPIGYIMGIFVFCLLFVTLMGLETLARFSKLSSYMLLILFFFVILLSSQNWDVYRLAPIFGHGLQKTVITGMSRGSVYADVIFLGVAAGAVQGLPHIRKIGYASIALSGILISIDFIAYTLTFPYYILSEMTAPMYQMASMIDYGRFVQRVEAFFLFVWVIGAFISVTLNFYAFTSTYCKAFRLQDIKPVAISSSVILLALASIPRDVTEIAYGYVNKTREYGWLVFFIPPVIALMVAKFRKRERRDRNA